MQQVAENVKSAKKGKAVDFERIASSEKYQQLKKEKTKFIVPLTIFFLAVYILLPILTSYTKVLHQPAIGSITWVWLYALSLFIVTWILCHVYVNKAAKFDESAKAILDENQLKGGE
ncbi:DUF485 domain-containing protein [Bacillus massilinigeriensis]|uniref:DUF485 domain-containing protein n=1 Tax=Bacillus massilionigeriensis TaxID=1805475 RepID=UPI00096ADFB1|nr:DUF485 domain-containing protein [Bacillus massilionigeriensis]